VYEHVIFYFFYFIYATINYFPDIIVLGSCPETVLYSDGGKKKGEHPKRGHVL
jgi:hypothetical protein